MVSPVNGCSGNSTCHGEDAELERLLEKLMNGEELTDEELKKLKKYLMSKGNTKEQADQFISNKGQSPGNETPADIK